MYTGTLIDDLMAAVERAECNIQPQPSQETMNFSLMPAIHELGQTEQNLLGAA